MSFMVVPVAKLVLVCQPLDLRQVSQLVRRKART